MCVFLKSQVKGDSVDVAGRKLKEVHSQYQEKTKEFDRLYEAFTKTSQVGGASGRSSAFPRVTALNIVRVSARQEIQMKRTAIEAFNETMLIFEEQCREQERYGEEIDRNNCSEAADKDLER